MWPGDQVAGDDEEDVDADVAAGDEADARRGQSRTATIAIGAQALDVGAERGTAGDGVRRHDATVALARAPGHHTMV